MAEPVLRAGKPGSDARRDGASYIGGSKPADGGKSPIMNFTNFPLWLREGPWKVGALLYIPLLIALVVALSPVALRAAPSYLPSVAGEPAPRAWLTASAMAWTILVMAYMFATTGSWPMVTFTMLSWTMLTLRFACVLGAPWSRALWLLGEALRGPALLNSVFLAGVWWFALVPLIAYFSRTAHARRAFLKFNFSFFLVNVHAANVPLGVLSHSVAPRTLTLFDLWTTLAFSAAYVLFYLGVMDPKGLHLYIILSPRSHFAPVVYSALLGAQLCIFSSLGGSLSM